MCLDLTEDVWPQKVPNEKKVSASFLSIRIGCVCVQSVVVQRDPPCWGHPWEYKSLNSSPIHCPLNAFFKKKKKKKKKIGATTAAYGAAPLLSYHLKKNPRSSCSTELNCKNISWHWLNKKALKTHTENLSIFTSGSAKLFHACLTLHLREM